MQVSTLSSLIVNYTDAHASQPLIPKMPATWTPSRQKISWQSKRKSCGMMRGVWKSVTLLTSLCSLLNLESAFV